MGKTASNASPTFSTLTWVVLQIREEPEQASSAAHTRSLWPRGIVVKTVRCEFKVLEW
jgi:hypothetical protein